MTNSKPVRTLVDLQNITCAYGSVLALHESSLTITSESFLAIVGPSGAGKTTVLRAIIGSLQPVSGVVERTADLRLGYVPQIETVSWNFPITVGEVVLLADSRPRLKFWASKSEKEQVEVMLDRLGMGGLSGRHIRELSGGQQQRVFLARALLRRPDLLVLDEPTSGVDVRTRHDLLHLLEELHEQGIAIVLTTHDLNGVATHIPHLVCVNKSIVAAGPACQVLCSEVLERTFDAPMQVLQHGGLTLVVDRQRSEREAG